VGVCILESTSKVELLGATAPSASGTPHDLLGPVYAVDFAPFLQQIARVANQATAR
jgi:hypothetical protein